MRQHLTLLLILLSGVTAAVGGAATNRVEEAVADGPTYVIPVNGMIEKGLLYAMRRGVDNARAANAGAIILHMDTPGGSVAVTEDIIRLLMALPESVETYTFIDKDALSAGALISMATEHIYMSTGSRIGASALVTAFGDVKEGDMKEKHVSALLALVSSAAVKNGHDPELVEAMVRRDASYHIGEEVICEEGELLTLTEGQAARIVGEGEEARPLLSEGTVESLDELLRTMGRPGDPLRLDITWSEKVARWIQTLSILFLVGGLLGLYIEFKVPGFGLPGILGIACLAVFFWGHHVAGLAGMEEVLVFLIGAVLLAVELFVIPGFGVTGVLGILLILTSLGMAMVQHYPGGSLMPPSDQVATATTNLSLATVCAFVGMVILARFLPETRAFKHLVLESSEDRGVGFESGPGMASREGEQGVADTDLRPAGIGVFGDDRLTVVSRGTFLKQGTPIVIAETHGNRIVVDPVAEDSDTQEEASA